MANLVASDVTYTVLKRTKINGSPSRYRHLLAVSTAAGDYPTGGIPLDIARMGFRAVVESVSVLEGNGATAHMYKYDYSAFKLKIYTEQTNAYAEHPNSAFTSPDQLVIEAIGY